MPAQILQNVIAYDVYDEDQLLLGSAEATLPSLEAITETFSGGGILGEIESSSPGHYKSMTLGLSWNTVNRSLAKLSQIKLHTLTLRASISAFNLNKSLYAKQPLKIVAEVKPKKSELGKLEATKKMDAKSEYEVYSLQVWLDDSLIYHIDKLRQICLIDGNDQLADIRKHTGR